MSSQIFDMNSLLSFKEWEDSDIIKKLNELKDIVDFKKDFIVFSHEVYDYNVGEVAEHLLNIKMNIPYFLWDKGFSQEVILHALELSEGVFVSNKGLVLKELDLKEKIKNLIIVINKIPENEVYPKYPLYGMLYLLRDYIEQDKQKFSKSERENLSEIINKNIRNYQLKDKNILIYNQGYHVDYPLNLPIIGSVNDSLLNYLIRNNYESETLELLRENRFDLSSYDKKEQYHPANVLKYYNKSDFDILSEIINKQVRFSDNLIDKLLRKNDANLLITLVKQKTLTAELLTTKMLNMIFSEKNERISHRSIELLEDFMNDSVYYLDSDFLTNYLFENPVDVSEKFGLIDLFKSIKQKTLPKNSSTNKIRI